MNFKTYALFPSGNVAYVGKAFLFSAKALAAGSSMPDAKGRESFPQEPPSAGNEAGTSSCSLGGTDETGLFHKRAGRQGFAGSLGYVFLLALKKMTCCFFFSRIISILSKF